MLSSAPNELRSGITLYGCTVCTHVSGCGHVPDLVTAPLVRKRSCSWVSSLSAPRTATRVASLQRQPTCQSNHTYIINTTGAKVRSPRARPGHGPGPRTATGWRLMHLTPETSVTCGCGCAGLPSVALTRECRDRATLVTRPWCVVRALRGGTAIAGTRGETLRAVCARVGVSCSRFSTHTSTLQGQGRQDGRFSGTGAPAWAPDQTAHTIHIPVEYTRDSPEQLLPVPRLS